MATLLEQLLAQSEQYTRLVGQFPAGIYLAAIIAYLLTAQSRPAGHVAVSALLGAAWIWLGGVFWLSLLGGQGAAAVWGLLFLLQGYLLIAEGVAALRPCRRPRSRRCRLPLPSAARGLNPVPNQMSGIGYGIRRQSAGR